MNSDAKLESIEQTMRRELTIGIIICITPAIAFFGTLGYLFK